MKTAASLFLVCWILLICDVKSELKETKKCFLTDQDLKELDETLYLIRSGSELTTSLFEDFKIRTTSSNDCQALVSFFEKMEEILVLKESDESLESHISSLGKLRNELFESEESRQKLKNGKEKVSRVKRTTEEEQLKEIRKDLDMDLVPCLSADDFLKIENKENLVEGFVRDYYGGSLKKLGPLVKFSGCLKDFGLTLKAQSTLFQEMKKHNHTHGKELLQLHYNIGHRIDDSKLSEDQKNRFLSLRNETEPMKDEVLKAMEAAFNPDKLDFFYTYTYLLQPEQKSFLTEFARRISSRADYKSIFKEILGTSQGMADDSRCIFLEQVFLQVESKGDTESFEALQLWNTINFYMLIKNGDQSAKSDFEKCKPIHAKLTPTKEKFMVEYDAIMSTGNHSTLYIWHYKFSQMGYFLFAFVKDAPASRFTNVTKFDQFATFMEGYNYDTDKVWVTEIAQAKLESLNLTLSSQAFYVSKLAHRMLTKGKYLDDAEKAKCSRVLERGPKVYSYLVKTKLDKCKLSSDRGDLYCPSSQLDNANRDRPIFTGTENTDNVQYWKIFLDAFYARFNNFRFYRSLTHFDGEDNVFGVERSAGSKFWRVEAVDMTSQMIKIHTEAGRYLSAAKSEDSVKHVKLNDGLSNAIWNVTCV